MLGNERALKPPPAPSRVLLKLSMSATFDGAPHVPPWSVDRDTHTFESSPSPTPLQNVVQASHNVPSADSARSAPWLRQLVCAASVETTVWAPNDRPSPAPLRSRDTTSWLLFDPPNGVQATKLSSLCSASTRRPSLSWQM